MILMDEMLPLRLYSSKQPAYLPFNPTDKKKGAMITLLTKSMDDSITLINTPWLRNPNYFISYYMDRNVKHYLTSDGNIKLDVEDEDPDVFEEMAFREDVNTDHKKPICKAYGSTNDQRILEQYFNKGAFDKWYDFFQIRKMNRIYPNVYAFANLADMNNAVGVDLIEKESKITPNSFNTSTEIFCLCGSEYNLFLAEGTYDQYCETAVITYVVNNSFPRCNWTLANRVGMMLSGALDYIYEKNDRKTSDKISMALFIKKFYEKNGRMALIKALKEGDYIRLFKYGAKDFYKRIKTTILESDGTHQDAVNIFNNMSEKDKNFLDRTHTFVTMDKTKKCLFRHIAKDDIYDLKGFIEVYEGPQPHSGIVVIGVDPKYRNQKVASNILMPYMFEHIANLSSEVPELTNLIWYVDNKNGASIRLAKKNGFELVRESSTQKVYRKWIDKTPEWIKDIPSSIKNETSLVKYVNDHFKYTDPVWTHHVDGTDTYFRIPFLTTILKESEKNYLHTGYFCYRALQNMAFNVSFVIALEHNEYAQQFGGLIAFNVITYSDGSSIILDPLDPSFSSGMGKVKNVKDVLDHYEYTHKKGMWGDYPQFKFMSAYVPTDDDLNAGRDVIDMMVGVTGDQRNIKESALLELNTSSIATDDHHKGYKSLNKFKKLTLNGETIAKWKNAMPDLCHIKTKKGCHGYLWIDDKENKPVCYYNSEKKEDENAPGNYVVWLQAIQVDDNYQGYGLGGQMIDVAIDEDNITNLAVKKDNEKAIKLYEKNGFHPYIANGDMVYMQLNEYTDATQHHEESLYIPVDSEACMFFEGQMFVFTEVLGQLSQNTYNMKLRRYLWKQRIRKPSDMVAINNHIKEACPKVRKAYVKTNLYQKRNIYYDLSYYNGLFLQNNKTIKDIAVRFYLEYLGRMLNNYEEYFRTNYSKNTIFIPIWKGAWDIAPGTDIYDWKTNLNPVSMMFRLIRKDPIKLKELFGNRLVVFIGKTGYFRVDFNNFAFKNIARFKRNLGKLWRMEPIEADEKEDGYTSPDTEENSTAAIAVELIDKIEKTTKIKFDDVSAAINKEPMNTKDSIIPVKPNIPYMRIRTTRLPSMSQDLGVAVVAPTQDQVIELMRNKEFYEKFSSGKVFGGLNIHSFYTKK